MDPGCSYHPSTPAAQKAKGTIANIHRLIMYTIISLASCLLAWVFTSSARLNTPVAGGHFGVVSRAPVRKMNHDGFKTRRRLPYTKKRVRRHDVSSSKTSTRERFQQDPPYSYNNYDVTNIDHQSSYQSTQQISLSLIKPKIINGNPVPANHHPYLVRIYKFDPRNRPYLFRRREPFHLLQKKDSYYHCGGSLISPNVILTAAHCVDDDLNHLEILDATENGKVKSYIIQQKIIHPKFQNGYFGFDFALLKIDSTHLDVIENVGKDGHSYWSLRRDDSEHTGIDWTKPPIMRLHRHGHKNGEFNNSCDSIRNEEHVHDITKLTVLGYGGDSASTFSNTNAKSETNVMKSGFAELKTADVHYLKNDECNTMYGSAPKNALSRTKSGSNNRIITDDMMCALDAEEGQDACSGDSGNPLLALLPPLTSSSLPALPKLVTQVGLVSWGLGCARSNYPGVYSRISEEIDWIDETICNVRIGLSPLSCVYDGISKTRRLNDHALEAVTQQHSENDAEVDDSASDSSDTMNTKEGVQNKEHLGSTNRKDSIALDFEQLSVPVDEACELLEGPSIYGNHDSKALSQKNKNDEEKTYLIRGSNDESNAPLIIFGFDDEQNLHQPIEAVIASEEQIMHTPISDEQPSILTENSTMEVNVTVYSVSNDEDMPFMLENINEKPLPRSSNKDTSDLVTTSTSSENMEEHNELNENPLKTSEQTTTNTICELAGNNDVTYFFADDMRLRNCEWVIKKKWERCRSYGKCCPDSCHGNN